MKSENTVKTKIDVLMCTFRRAEFVQTLQSIAAQELPNDIAVRVVVADNDDTPSAQAETMHQRDLLGLNLDYIHAPARNISIARNSCLDASSADWVAFIDDDEVGSPTWLASLYGAALMKEADAVFGPVRAIYPPDAPQWMQDYGYHSTAPVLNGGEMTTGYAGNALLKWADQPWYDLRFDIARGRSGGEDTAFFYTVNQLGGRFVACETAELTENVMPDRISLSWLMRRKFRSGQSHVVVAEGVISNRIRLGVLALGKVGVCFFCASLLFWSPARARFWILRGGVHLGVIAGCLSLPEREHYGQ